MAGLTLAEGSKTTNFGEFQGAGLLNSIPTGWRTQELAGVLGKKLEIANKPDGRVNQPALVNLPVRSRPIAFMQVWRFRILEGLF